MPSRRPSSLFPLIPERKARGRQGRSAPPAPTLHQAERGTPSAHANKKGAAIHPREPQ